MKDVILLTPSPAVRTARYATTEGLPVAESGINAEGQIGSQNGVSLLSPVGWTVSQHPELARILEKWGIHYCCSEGGLSLLEACGRHGVDIHVILQEIEDYETHAAARSICDASLTKAELLERVRENHGALSTDICRLSDLINRVSQDHGAIFHELWELQTLFAAFKAEWAERELLLDPALAEGENSDGGENYLYPWLEYGRNTSERMARVNQWAETFAVPTGLCQTCRVMLTGIFELNGFLNDTLTTDNMLLRHSQQ